MTREQLDAEIAQHEARMIALKAELYDEETALTHLRAMRDAWQREAPAEPDLAQLRQMAAQHGFHLVRVAERA